MPATTFAELFGAVFPTAAQVESGVVYGPTGADFTGTLGDGITIGSRFTPTFNSPNEVYPTEAQVELGVVYGPDGSNFTGSLTGGAAPTTPGTLIGEIVTLDEMGAAEAAVSVSIQMIEGPGDVGYCYDSTVWTVTSDANGLAEFDGIIPEARYSRWRGTSSRYKTFIAPAADSALVVSGRFDIEETIGAD